MSNSTSANTNPTLVALVGGLRLPIVGWTSGGRPITPITSPFRDPPPVLDTKTNLVYTRNGVTPLEHYEESING